MWSRCTAFLDACLIAIGWKKPPRPKWSIGDGVGQVKPHTGERIVDMSDRFERLQREARKKAPAVRPLTQPFPEDNPLADKFDELRKAALAEKKLNPRPEHTEPRPPHFPPNTK